MPRSRHRSTMASSRSRGLGVALLDPVTGEDRRVTDAVGDLVGDVVAGRPNARVRVPRRDLDDGHRDRCRGARCCCRGLSGESVGGTASCLVTRRTHHRRYGGLAALARRCRFRRGRRQSRRTWRGHPLTDLVTGRRTLAFFSDSTLRLRPPPVSATVVVEESDEVWLPRDVAWSPDGRTLAWMAFPEAEPTMGKHIVIAASNVDGTNRRVLFDAGFASSPAPRPGFVVARWHPDGVRDAVLLRSTTHGPTTFPATGVAFCSSSTRTARPPGS